MTAARIVIGVVVALWGLSVAVSIHPTASSAPVMLPLALIAIAVGAAVATFAALDAMGEPK